jgi:hypothetical protein
MLTTVVEMTDFVRRAKAAMSEAERNDLIDFLAARPESGVSLGHGLWKVRFARPGAGKSGGFRTIHYYRAEAGPVILLTMFAKNEKANLSASELSALHTLSDELSRHYGRQS